MKQQALRTIATLSFLLMLTTATAYAQSGLCGAPNATLLATGLEGATGSTVGPGGALYVTEGAAGRISRVDPQTGEITTFASGLPKSIIGIGGAIDVAFIGQTAYVLVTLVGSQFGGSDVVGIYRVDGPNSFTVVADIGEFNLHNPPTIPFPFFIPTGLQFALETYRGGFLVTDGHLNRVLRVTLDGEVTVLIAFDDVVPTGLAVSGNTGRPPLRRWPPARPSLLTWNLAAAAVSTPSRRATFWSAAIRVLRRCRTPARSSRSTETGPSPSSWTVWTGRPRSSS